MAMILTPNEGLSKGAAGLLPDDALQIASAARLPAHSDEF